MIRTVIPKMRSSESLIYCGGKWQLLQLNKIGFFNWDARENRCCWDNNNKIHHQRTGSFLITRGVEKSFCAYIEGRGGKGRCGFMKKQNKVHSDKGHGKGQGSRWLLCLGLCFSSWPLLNSKLWATFILRRSYCQASPQLSQTSQLGVPTHSLLTQIALEIPQTAGTTSVLRRV